MEQEKARALQTTLMHEGVAALILAGTVADVSLHEQAIVAIGEAWNLPEQDTQQCLQTLREENEVVRSMEAGHIAQHACGNADVLYTPTGPDIMEIVWGLFETTTRLSDESKRIGLYRMSNAIVECMNLDEWMEKPKSAKREVSMQAQQ